MLVDIPAFVQHFMWKPADVICALSQKQNSMTAWVTYSAQCFTRLTANVADPHKSRNVFPNYDWHLVCLMAESVFAAVPSQTFICLPFDGPTSKFHCVRPIIESDSFLYVAVCLWIARFTLFFLTCIPYVARRSIKAESGWAEQEEVLMHVLHANNWLYCVFVVIGFSFTLLQFQTVVPKHPEGVRSLPTQGLKALG